jgi:hypothetical protein
VRHNSGAAFDPMLGLLEKNGLICREIARDVIGLEPGTRIRTTSEYARLLRAGQGTVQKAFKTLEDMGAVEIETRGHRGTYLNRKDLGRLWAISGLGTVTGMMPLPDSGEFEGIATALTLLYREADIPFNLLHLNGATRRVEYLKSGADFVVLSRFAAERARAADGDLRLLLSCGPDTFYRGDSLAVLTRPGTDGSEVRRVGLDGSSWDHAEITRREFSDRPVEFVQTPYHMIPDLILGGSIDAAVWRRTTKRVEAASRILNLRPLGSEGARRMVQDQSSLAVVSLRDNDAKNSLFQQVIDEARLSRIQREVMSGERIPLF